MKLTIDQISAEMTDRVLEFFMERKGFVYWWEDIDRETRLELAHELEETITDELENWIDD
jgi:hypothetical protein